MRSCAFCQVFLPYSGWVCFWSGKQRQGPMELRLSVPLPRIPLFVRCGSVLEVLPRDTHTLVDCSGLDPQKEGFNCAPRWANGGHVAVYPLTCDL